MRQSRRYKHTVLAIVFAAALSSGSAHADFVFGTPMNLGPTVNSSARDEEPGISANGLSIYYCSLRSGGYGGYDMWVTSRATTEDVWGPPANLGPTVNSTSDDFSEDISVDGLELYFGSNRPGGVGSYDIWVAKRATTQDDWTPPVNLGPMVNSSSQEGCPAISDDGLELYFWSTRAGGAGGYDIWVSRRLTTQDDWGQAENLGPVANSLTTELCTDISPDGLSLILVSARSGSYGGNLGDLWIVRRPTTIEPWGVPLNLGPLVNGASNENGPCLSADGATLYFSSDRPGGYGEQDMWQVSINPVLDFNGDGAVNVNDLLRLIESWGKDDPTVDIAPPLGDGVIDAKDLDVLMTRWQQDVDDPTLMTNWTLDEMSGVIAADSTSSCDAVVCGDPIWEPEGGAVGGALVLDGIDDFLATDFVLDPSEGPFSVFAWVQGGAPGQVLTSQAGGANWLMIDASAGTLATELTNGGRIQRPLISGAMVTDGGWHRIGFTWDGNWRSLYVDDTLVATDEQINLAACTGGLNIGCGKDMDPDSFFTGLIDDVRIYGRAVRP